jgi:hypothetical protein
VCFSVGFSAGLGGVFGLALLALGVGASSGKRLQIWGAWVALGGRQTLLGAGSQLWLAGEQAGAGVALVFGGGTVWVLFWGIGVYGREDVPIFAMGFICL